MKKMTALLLALVMALCSTGALAEMDFTQGFTAEVSYELNTDMFVSLMEMTAGSAAMEEMPEEMLEAVFGLINQITLTGAYDNETLNISANLKGTPLITLEGGTLEDGSLALNTNLLPSYALALDAETMGQLKAQMESAMGQIDLEKIMAASEKFQADAMQLMDEAWQAVLSEDYVTEETGTYLLEDVTYTRKLTVDTDSNELLVHLQALMVKLVPLMEEYYREIGFPTEELGFEDMKEAFTDDIPMDEAVPMYVNVYDMAKGAVDNDHVYVTLEMADEEAVMAMVVGVYGQEVEASLYFGEGSYASVDEIVNAAYAGTGNAMVMDVAMIISETMEEANAVYSVVTGGIFLGYYVETKPVDGGVDMDFELYLMTDEAPMMSVKAALRPLTEKLAPVSVEGKELVNLVSLAEMDEEMEQALTTDMQSALTGVLISAISAAPDEIQAIMNLAVQMENGEVETMDENQDMDWDDTDADADWTDDGAADADTDAVMNSAVDALTTVVNK